VSWRVPSSTVAGLVVFSVIYRYEGHGARCRDRRPRRVERVRELVHVGVGGVESRERLEVAARLALELGRPVRRFPSYRGQRSFPGLYWSATMGDHVGYESWGERDHLVAPDFDPQVVAVASQPFWLHWVEADGSARRHAPDFFVRMAGGGAPVFDLRPPDLIKERDQEVFAATAVACGLAGWRYAAWGSEDPVPAGNLRWLSGYRHPRCLIQTIARQLLDCFLRPQALMAGAERVGDPLAVLPVLFHLMWRGELGADLLLVLSDRTVVSYRFPFLTRCSAMIDRGSVLRVGDRLVHDDAEHTVVGLSGVMVRLLDDAGQVSVVSLAYLTSAPGFALVAGGSPHRLDPLGLLDGLSEEVLAEARMWERHLVKLETGLVPGAGQDAVPRPEYDPGMRSLTEREAKAAELTADGVSATWRTVRRKRQRYREQGLLGLVNARALKRARPGGRADERVLAAVEAVVAAQTNGSIGTKTRAIRLIQ
jgi:putative transposase